MKRESWRNTVGTEYIPFYLEREIPKRDATFKYGSPNKPVVVVSGGSRLITGQQNRSGSALGQKLVEVLTMQEESVSAGYPPSETVAIIPIDSFILLI